MATRRRKTRRSCKHGKLKKPIRTKKGGRRRCKMTKSSRKSKKKVSRKLSRKSSRKPKKKTKKKYRYELKKYDEFGNYADRVDPKTGKIIYKKNKTVAALGVVNSLLSGGK